MNFKRFFAAVTAAAILCLIVLSGCSNGNNPGSAGKETPAGGSADTASDQPAADLLDQIRAKGEITVALEGTWAPWGYHDENNQLVGYDVEIAQNIAKKLGVKVNFAEGEWSGLLAGLDGGRYDIMVNGMDVDEERKEKYDFSATYAYNRTVVITRADNDSIQAMEDLDGKTTANTLQSTYEAVGLKYGATVTPVDDFIQTIELLTSGRIDATLNAEVSYYDYLKAHPDAPIKIACIDSDVTQVAIPLRKGEETRTLREAIDQALAEMAEDGTLSELSVKYFGTDISKGEN